MRVREGRSVATNLSDIGFAAQTGPELEALARKCYENGRATRCAQGIYIRWQAGQGVELWAQLSLGEELLGLNPHFGGTARASLGLMERVTRHGFPLDGGFKCLGQPYGCDPIRGAFPCVFDCPDFWLHDKLNLPQIQTVQAAAFAQQCALFANEEDFQAMVSRRGTRMSSDACLAMGLTGASREPLAEPLASAMLAGRVQDAALLVNPFSKHKFWSVRLQNALGEVDLVADPELLAAAPKAGNILQASVWLSGRIVN